jgi:hypothetical protein
MNFSHKDKFKNYLLLLVSTVTLTTITACSQPVQLAKPANIGVPATTTTQESSGTAPIADSTKSQFSQNTSLSSESENSGNGGVEIMQIHYRGSLQPLGCCDTDLYEKDEFVVIQNRSKIPQNIAGWKLENLNKDYITFIFPEYFPCIPFSPAKGDQYAVNTSSFIANAPETVEQIFSSSDSTKQQSKAPSDIDWSSCFPTEPLDETPLKPLPNQEQGKPLKCILQPGQLILIFTDEIHCQYGGFSFNYGLGNIWDNTNPNTAVLYNAEGHEVSRRSYTTAK